MRFANAEVHGNLEGVVAKIGEAIARLRITGPPLTAPASGRGDELTPPTPVRLPGHQFAAARDLPAISRAGRSVTATRGSAETAAFSAERLTAGAGAQIFPLNIVAGVAVGVVVVDIRKDRVPRSTLSHDAGSFCFGGYGILLIPLEGSREAGFSPRPTAPSNKAVCHIGLLLARAPSDRDGLTKCSGHAVQRAAKTKFGAVHWAAPISLALEGRIIIVVDFCRFERLRGGSFR
jgi:hypothetical protein